MKNNNTKCRQKEPDFIYDEACLDIYNFRQEEVHIYGQYVECNECDYQSLWNLTSGANSSLLINTKYSMRMQYRFNGTSSACDWNHNLLEHYRYGWNITNSSCPSLYIKTEANNAYLPILSAFIILFFFGTIWYMVKCVYKCTKSFPLWRYIMTQNSSELQNNLDTPTETPLVVERSPPPPRPINSYRLKSVDVFRGVCIMFMIFVEYGGGQYWFFRHSIWNGLTIADLVFPWFLWLMGLSMALSFHNRLHNNVVPRRLLVLHVIKRCVILFSLGIILNSHGQEFAKPLSELRIMGVLQRIALTYLIVGLLEAAFYKRVTEIRHLNLLPEVLSAWPQWVFMISLVAIHSCVTFLVNVPGCGRGYLGPGGNEYSGTYFNCTGGVAGYIDRVVLGTHIYSRGSYKWMYGVKLNFDPEGILGTLTAAFLVFLGVHAGRIVNAYSSVQQKFIRWIACGIVFAVIGGALCGFTKNGGPIPINKKMSSLSFVFVLGGVAYLVFAFLFVVVDVTRKWGGRPFFYPGMNPLLLYVLHDLSKNTFPVAWVPTSQTHGAYLGMNLWGTAFWVCFSIFLYKHNVFVSI